MQTSSSINHISLNYISNPGLKAAFFGKAQVCDASGDAIYFIDRLIILFYKNQVENAHVNAGKIIYWLRILEKT
jgi:hypothetical protein